MKISEEIIKTALDSGICVKELPNEYVKRIKKAIFKKYVQSQPGTFLWEHFIHPSVIADSNGWEKICTYIGENNCLMFFDDIEDKSVILISNGNDLYKLLNMMFGFEFYITNFETDYLVCFNHHDCLLGCGTAKNWIESLK